MLKARRRTSILATIGVLAALYAILGLIPISRLVGISSFITFREALSPLIGMLLGPIGGFAIFIGVLLDFSLGRPIVFLGLDFLIDMAAVFTAGLAFTGRRKAAVLLPAILIAIFLANPTAAYFVDVGGIEIPFVWMHVISVGTLAVALHLELRGKIQRLSWIFVGSTMFASTMAGHMTGGILTEMVYLNQGILFGSGSVGAYWSFVFFLYPFERAFLATVGTAVSLPVLRTLSRMRQSKTEQA
jgi:hypothetical protein